MSEEKKGPYREGNDPENQSQQEVPPEEKGERVTPITTFLVALLPDGRIDLVLELPAMQQQRRATVEDVRMMANETARQAEAQLISQTMVRTMSESAKKAAEAGHIANIRSQIGNPRMS